MMLGALSRHIDLPEEIFIAALKANFPEKLHEVNVEMFRLGRNFR